MSKPFRTGAIALLPAVTLLTPGFCRAATVVTKEQAGLLNTIRQNPLPAAAALIALFILAAAFLAFWLRAKHAAHKKQQRQELDSQQQRQVLEEKYRLERHMLEEKHKTERHILKEQYQRDLLDLTGRDELTGLHNRKQFCSATQLLLKEHPNTQFVLMRLDISHFQLVNACFGVAEGDRLLKHMASVLVRFAQEVPPCTYGRMEADVFTLCCPYTGEEELAMHVSDLQRDIKRHPIDFNIIVTFGFYKITDPAEPVGNMLGYANLAAKSVKGNYMQTYAFYAQQMSDEISREQTLVNEFSAALEEKQFFIQIQPKYNLQTNLPAGGEALVRWRHPRLGLVSPGDFVPVFEKNGLIAQLDHYVWEETCELLHGWIQQGISPVPLSVNVSRVNLYHPQLVSIIYELVEKYGIPPALLQLELTESAYTDNPVLMQQLVKELHQKGFTILMDDFGNGYSSLNILKEIEVDQLKIDMRFLSKAEIPGRSENIVASVVRMAKWLGLPVIAEGAEEREQVDFLRSIGCEYVQGYYFSRPVDPEEYISLKWDVPAEQQTKHTPFDINSLWASNPQMELLFTGSLQAAGIYEYDPLDRQLECLRVNSAFHTLFCSNGQTAYVLSPLSYVVGDYRETVLTAVDRAIETQNAAECDYLRSNVGCKAVWINMKIKYISSVGRKHIMLFSFNNISSYKSIEDELQKYRSAIANISKNTKGMLVVDDHQINRAMLSKVFSPKFTMYEASNGFEALELLKEKADEIDIILLDMLMPLMNGMEFLQIKKETPSIESIPVVIVTADDSAEQQVNTLALGANDYVVKPIIPEVVIQRVNNVLESSSRFRAMLREYQSAVEQAKEDPLTRIFNRAAAEEAITAALRQPSTRKRALVMLDIDNFKHINDRYGHSYGDMVLIKLGRVLAEFFRSGDVIARMGGDEFCVLMLDVRTEKDAEKKCKELCLHIQNMTVEHEQLNVTCSIGVAINAPNITFQELYQMADQALYASKHAGKNRVTLYQDTQAMLSGLADDTPAQP